MSLQIYVASLSDYNAGILHGEWIDLEGKDKDDVLEEIEKMLAESPTAKEEGSVAEEWAVHDYDGFDGLTLGEHPDLEQLCAISEGYEEHGDAFLAWVGNDPNHNTEVSDFEEQYRGEHKSLSDYAYDFYEQMGTTELGPLANYINWEAVGRDLEHGGDIWTAEAPGGGIYVFQNY